MGTTNDNVLLTTPMPTHFTEYMQDKNFGIHLGVDRAETRSGRSFFKNCRLETDSVKNSRLYQHRVSVVSLCPRANAIQLRSERLREAAGWGVGWGGGGSDENEEKK